MHQIYQLTKLETFYLHVPAIEEYNNTEVVCSIRIPGEHAVESVLRVQGISCTCQDATPSEG